MAAPLNIRRIALLLPLLALGAMPRAPFQLESVLPETTLIFAETPSAPAFRAAFKTTPLAKMLEDEEVRAFLDDAFASAAKAFQGFGPEDKEFRWEKIVENVSGQIAVAMVGLLQGEH